MLVFILQSVVFILWLLVIASSPSSPAQRSSDHDNVYPRKPQFYYIKVGQNYIGMFSWWYACL